MYGLLNKSNIPKLCSFRRFYNVQNTITNRNKILSNKCIEIFHQTNEIQRIKCNINIKDKSLKSKNVKTFVNMYSLNNSQPYTTTNSGLNESKISNRVASNLGKGSVVTGNQPNRPSNYQNGDKNGHVDYKPSDNNLKLNNEEKESSSKQTLHGNSVTSVGKKKRFQKFRQYMSKSKRMNKLKLYLSNSKSLNKLRLYLESNKRLNKLKLYLSNSRRLEKLRVYILNNRQKLKGLTNNVKRREKLRLMRSKFKEKSLAFRIGAMLTLKRYGKIGAIIYFGVYGVTLAGMNAIVFLNYLTSEDVRKALNYLNISSVKVPDVDSPFAKFTVAYIATKIVEPLRLVVSILLTVTFTKLFRK
ncbi:uncharacterized protein TA14340 [Theileria annulata]|uniref:DUF1279 domain-containing protein n=1 Tax=Theileria annulata TaxID=5874 RepID=Q4UF02_THEAN|nr:uncharacterized protein TA14340 [Theileria annulata]CAI74337.1 hypothetical protein, conserved [Theileria annulata]|eukprot:XP_952069.1 hypothetical protein, conserved [Theileria annulata]